MSTSSRRDLISGSGRTDLTLNADSTGLFWWDTGGTATDIIPEPVFIGGELECDLAGLTPPPADASDTTEMDSAFASASTNVTAQIMQGPDILYEINPTVTMDFPNMKAKVRVMATNRPTLDKVVLHLDQSLSNDGISGCTFVGGTPLQTYALNVNDLGYLGIEPSYTGRGTHL